VRKIKGLRAIYEPKGAVSKFLLTCPPRIIAEACLEVLEG
jgi:hypothetical protein